MSASENDQEIRMARFSNPDDDSGISQVVVFGIRGGEAKMLTCVKTIQEGYDWLKANGKLTTKISFWKDGAMNTRLTTDADWVMLILRES